MNLLGLLCFFLLFGLFAQLFEQFDFGLELRIPFHILLLLFLTLMLCSVISPRYQLKVIKS